MGNNSLKETRTKRRFNFILLLVLVAVSVLMTGCAIGEKAKIKKILTENGSVIGDFDVITTVDLAEDTEGLQGKNSLVLCKSNENQNYGLTIVDKKNKSVTDFAFEYKPQNIIVTKIFNGSEDMNVKNTNLIAKFIENDGVDCFLNHDIAEEYIREATGENGFFSTETARQAIIDSLSYIIPRIGEYDDYTVIFEEYNANPKYYAGQTTTTSYRWNQFFDESVYKVWKASTDRETQEIMRAMYGEPYEMKTVWVAVDKNLKKQVGTFDSKEAMEKKLESN